jgi:hypothetical protein
VFNSIWYRFTAPRLLRVTGALGESDQPVSGAVYTGTSLADLQPVLCIEDVPPSGIFQFFALRALAHRTYYIQLGAPSPEEARTIRLRLEPAASVAGVVRDRAHRPLDGICVTAFDPSGRFVASTVSGRSGRYALSSLPSGSYRVQFMDCRETPAFATEWWNDRPSFEEADPVGVAPGARVRGIDAFLEPAP